ncbi:uncharacterized protein KY384_003875 [Bacidia gigantensis]|uniref:uncharacterized protein n=1 Tax=Bacidia gigantensis TaxID=2732470 RepID=UPI001D053B85|nr:uncharacterized protein KY384_003875 [Bacidia gigantensis]KAG8532234.1 hypothetical protein KY384_003875 [Bacidia gigantensis]
MSSAKRALTDLLPLPNSNVKIPQLGFGIYQSKPEVCVNSCSTALRAGYRHIDSAQFYRNETEMGVAARQSGIPRSELFLTTKILSAGGSPEKTYQKCLESVKKIGAEGESDSPGSPSYVDLFLIHSPSAGSAARKEMWQALEKLEAEGRTKAIGVSNFGVGHIEELKEYARIWPPHINQIEVSGAYPALKRLALLTFIFQLHPWNQQRTIVDYCNEHKIIIEAYCPLVRNQKAHDETLLSISKKYDKTTAQVLIRYGLQKGWVSLPKSDTPSRIEANVDVYGFEIDDTDMTKLDDLDQGPAGAIVQAVKN